MSALDEAVALAAVTREAELAVHRWDAAPGADHVAHVERAREPQQQQPTDAAHPHSQCPARTPATNVNAAPSRTGSVLVRPGLVREWSYPKPLMRPLIGERPGVLHMGGVL